MVCSRTVTDRYRSKGTISVHLREDSRGWDGHMCVGRSRNADGAGRVATRMSTGGPLFVVLVTVLSDACCKQSRPTFTVEPSLTCPGETVQVQWNVHEKAKLRVERGSGDWDEEEVASSGRRI